MERKHGGNLRKLSQESGLAVEKILDFSANINPLGLPKWLRPLINKEIENLVHYPDPESASLLKALSQSFCISPERIVIANGSTELIYTIPRVVGATNALIPVPSYGDYLDASQCCGLHVEPIYLPEDKNFRFDFKDLEGKLRGKDKDTLVFLGQPNNPTGLMFDRDLFCRFAEKYRDILFCVDEAFADFVPGYRSLISEALSNVIVLRSFTKFYAIPGLRLGCLAATPELAKKIRVSLPTWSVNSFAQAVGLAALKDREYAEKTRQYVEEERDFLTTTLSKLPGLIVYSGSANFLLIRNTHAFLTTSDLAERLLNEGIAIRECSSFIGMGDDFFRIAVRTRQENERLCEAIQRHLGTP